jgi:hypothetical protein
MEEKRERLDLWAEQRVEVVASGRTYRPARLIHTGLPKGHDQQWHYHWHNKPGSDFANQETRCL